MLPTRAPLTCSAQTISRQADFFFYSQASPLTLDVELYGRVGHPHDVLGDAGQLEVVVVSTDVDQGQVDGVDVGPVQIGLRRHRGEK